MGAPSPQLRIRASVAHAGLFPPPEAWRVRGRSGLASCSPSPSSSLWTATRTTATVAKVVTWHLHLSGLSRSFWQQRTPTRTRQLTALARLLSPRLSHQVVSAVTRVLISLPRL